MSKRLCRAGQIVLCLAVVLIPTAGARGVAAPRFDVVAAENFWGSIASQLAGDKATVESIIVNPDTDPHSYEPTSADARTASL